MRSIVLASCLLVAGCSSSEVIRPDPSSIAAGSSGDSQGATSGSRLRARTLAGSDGSKQFVGWHDSERDEDCAFAKTSEGQRCVPTGAVAATYFTDAACSQPIAILTGDPCSTAPPKYVTTVSDACSGSIVHLFAVGKKMAAPAQVYAKSGSACSTTAGATEVYAASSEVMLTDLVAATETVE